MVIFHSYVSLPEGIVEVPQTDAEKCVEPRSSMIKYPP